MKRQFMKVLIIIFGILLILFSEHVAHSGSLEDIDFKDSHILDEMTLHLKGTGTIRHLRFFTVNAVALYIGSELEPQDVFSDIPKRLEFEYFYDITAEDFIELTNTWITKNNAPETISQLQPRLERFNAFYEDIQPGDRYALTYIPGRGTTLELNEAIKGTIPGRDFAEALFSIWFGEKPVSKSLKNSLLKN